MPPIPILVDTNLLWKPAIRNQLTAKIELGQIQVFVPTIMHAERIRQIADAKGEDFAISVVQQAVIASKFQLLSFETEDAEEMANIWLTLKTQGFSSENWEKHRFDIFLCAIASSRSYQLVTDDKGEHFNVVNKMDIDQLKTWLDSL